MIISLIALTIAGCSSRAPQQQSSADAAADSCAQAVKVPQFNADSAVAYVDRQVAFGPRVPGSDAHRRCADFLIEEFGRRGADTVMVQTGNVVDAEGRHVEARNIIARYNTAAPKRILLAAHYDTRPWADEDADASTRRQPILGANDGGSGVGVLLEIARLIGEQQPAVGVDFLLTDVEDSGASGDEPESATTTSWCLGSQYWAENCPYTSANRPAFGILLDMVGGRNAQFYREYVSEQVAPLVNAKVWNMAARLGIDRFVNEARGAVTDDHLFITKAGIPCIDIIECANPFTGAFPEYWHTHADSMDQIDPATLSDVGTVVTNVIYNEPLN